MSVEDLASDIANVGHGDISWRFVASKGFDFNRLNVDDFIHALNYTHLKSTVGCHSYNDGEKVFVTLKVESGVEKMVKKVLSSILYLEASAKNCRVFLVAVHFNVTEDLASGDWSAFEE